jgi:hypothetical protein
MNKETTELIDKLASKLGTTAEHLWGVLVQQAPISASTNLALLIVMIIIVIVCVRQFRTHLPKSSGPGEPDNMHDVFVVMSIIVGSIVLIALCVVTIQSATMIAAGFFNPEYWALKEVLENVR